MRVLLDSSGGPSPPNTEFKDKNGELLGKSPFYSIYPYSTPHVFREISRGYAVFQSFQETKLLLNHGDTCKRVEAYTNETMEAFLNGFDDPDMQSPSIRELKKSLLSFLQVEIERFKQQRRAQ